MTGLTEPNYNPRKIKFSSLISVCLSVCLSVSLPVSPCAYLIVLLPMLRIWTFLHRRFLSMYITNYYSFIHLRFRFFFLKEGFDYVYIVNVTWLFNVGTGVRIHRSTLCRPFCCASYRNKRVASREKVLPADL